MVIGIICVVTYVVSEEAGHLDTVDGQAVTVVTLVSHMVEVVH